MSFAIRDRLFGVLDNAEIARHDTDLGGRGEFLRLDLVAHRLDRPHIGADENDIGFGKRIGESGAFREKAVARMHRFGAGFLTGGDDLVDQEIGLGGGRRAEMDRLVGHFDMQRVGVGVGIDGDGRKPHALRGLNDATSDFAAIGDENFTKHSRPAAPIPSSIVAPQLTNRARRPPPAFSASRRFLRQAAAPGRRRRFRKPSLPRPT